MGYIFKNSMYFFEYHNSYYAYSFVRHILIQVNGDVYSAVARKQMSKELEGLLRIWKKTKLISEFDETLQFKPQIKQIQFSYAPVHECNLRCRYCFAKHGENYGGAQKKMTQEMINKILDFVYFREFNFCKEYRIDFVSGGEPLLNFEIIQYTIEKSKKILENTDKKLIVFLATNGTIYKSEMLEYLDQNNVNIGISIDGNRKAHNENRYYPDGTGSYEKVLQTISLIKKSNKLSKRIKDVWGMSVITGQSKNFSEIIENLHSIGINHMQMELVRTGKNIQYSVNDGNVEGIIKEYAKLTDYFVKEINYGSFENLKIILNEHDYYGKILCRVIDGGRMYYRCLAGMGKFNFDAEGDIYPCECFVGNADFCIGNVDEGIDEDKRKLFYNENIEFRIKCKDCWARYVCGGDCYFNSYVVNDSIYIPDKCFCKLNKKIIEYALVVMMMLKKKGLYRECANFIRMKKVLTSVAGGNSRYGRERDI